MANSEFRVAADTPNSLFAIRHLLFLLLALSACTPPPIGGGNGPIEGAEPFFPESYRTEFALVRDCRFGIEHGGVMYRVYANETARESYLNDENPLPLGSVLVKEEFDAINCDDDSKLLQWRAMLKEAPGFDANDGDWAWQRVRSDRGVTENTKTSCIGCHRVPECLERDYMCTEP